MDCREFEQRLPLYLEGALGEPELGRMVRHETSCRHCHELASERMTEPARPLADPTWTTETLRRTLGADCAHIAQRLAERLDADWPAMEATLVERHLVECAGCRALAAVLTGLPEFYRALPRLRADREFTRQVMLRTVGREPRLRTILRAFWRSPSLLWEGALACSLIFTPILGRPVLDGVGLATRHIRTAYAEAMTTAAAADSTVTRAPLGALAVWSAAIGQRCSVLRARAEAHATPLIERAEGVLVDLRIIAPVEDSGSSQGGQDELQQP